MKCKKVDVFYKSRKTAKQKNQTTNKHQTTPKTKKTSSKLSETVKLQACQLEGPVYIQSFLFAISAVMRQIYCLTYMSNSCDSGCWFAFCCEKTSNTLFVHKLLWSEWIRGDKGSLAHPRMRRVQKFCHYTHEWTCLHYEHQHFNVVNKKEIKMVIHPVDHQEDFGICTPRKPLNYP